jgi:hypothetical protein
MCVITAKLAAIAVGLTGLQLFRGRGSCASLWRRTFYLVLLATMSGQSATGAWVPIDTSLEWGVSLMSLALGAAVAAIAIQGLRAVHRSPALELCVGAITTTATLLPGVFLLRVP